MNRYHIHLVGTALRIGAARSLNAGLDRESAIDLVANTIHAFKLTKEEIETEIDKRIKYDAHVAQTLEKKQSIDDDQAIRILAAAIAKANGHSEVTTEDVNQALEMRRKKVESANVNSH
jgi:hypothetical protein